MNGIKELKEGLKVIMELGKIRITIAVSLTTVTGYILAGRSYDTGFVLPAVGIFLLACGASVLNHVQERKTDALMVRTLSRPVASHRISVPRAMIIAIAEIGAGSVILVLFANQMILLLGYLALICYNILYINLKKVTAHAVIPGSLVGTIPPLMGWMAAGGSLWDVHALLMSGFFFVWQVPHFYLLSLKYSSQYEMAGFPTIRQKMSATSIHRMIFAWVVVTALSGPVLLAGELLSSKASFVLIPAVSCWLIYAFLDVFKRPPSQPDYSRHFAWINFYFLACVVLMVSDPFTEQLLLSGL